MKICFHETEPAEVVFFAHELAQHEMTFVDNLQEVPAGTEILSVFINAQIGTAFLEAHPELKLITTRSTTMDHIDLAACAHRGVAVSQVDSYGDHIVAEHTFALLLAVTRRLRQALGVPKQTRFSYETLRGLELCGKTLGLIGVGRIGQCVVPIARAFGMHVLASDPEPHPARAQALGFDYVPFDELLGAADVISLHAPLTPKSHHLLDRAAFARCRRGVIIINTARGRLVDTAALLDALESGIVGGAGLDVLGEESVFRRDAGSLLIDHIVDRMHAPAVPPDSAADGQAEAREIEKLVCLQKLLARPDVVYTPHTAFNCIEAIQRINATTVRNIKKFIEGTLLPLTIEYAPRSAASDERCLTPNPYPVELKINSAPATSVK
jgi:D-lactate dehydrogenase